MCAGPPPVKNAAGSAPPRCKRRRAPGRGSRSSRDPAADEDARVAEPGDTTCSATRANWMRVQRTTAPSERTGALVGTFSAGVRRDGERREREVALIAASPARARAAGSAPRRSTAIPADKQRDARREGHPGPPEAVAGQPACGLPEYVRNGRRCSKRSRAGRASVAARLRGLAPRLARLLLGAAAREESARLLRRGAARPAARREDRHVARGRLGPGAIARSPRRSARRGADARPRARGRSPSAARRFASPARASSGRAASRRASRRRPAGA